MTRLVRLLDTTTSVLGPNRVEAIAGTSTRARDGHVVEMRGMDTSAFLRSGTILWSHDPRTPVGTPVSGRVDSAGNLRLVVDFAPPGASPRADEIRNLVKAGVVRNLSIGFDVADAEPLDPKNPRGGMRVTRSELLEVSFVSVPADPLAVVTARADRSGKVLSGVNATALREAHDLAERCRSTIADVLDGAGEGAPGDPRSGAASWRVGAAVDLPIEDSDEWDGGEAAQSIFAWSGGDDFSPAKAREGFLLYDASAPSERGSYKLPIAHAVRGQLKVPKGAIRAAASRLPQTNIPEEVKRRAGIVLDGYQKAAGVADDGRARRQRQAEALRLGAVPYGDNPDFASRQRQAEALRLGAVPHGDSLDFARRQRQAEALRLALR